MVTSAFTCTGPYAVLIMLGIKRVENRSAMPVPEKGRCAVTCMKSFNAAEFGNFVQWAAAHLPLEDFERIPAWADVKDWPGKVIGCCDYAAHGGRVCPKRADAEGRGSTDAIETIASTMWDEGYPCWWELSNVVCFDRPIPCRGNVGMWQMPSALAAQVTAADSLASCAGEKIATAEDAARLFRRAIPLAGSNEGLFVLPLDDAGCALSEPVLVSLGEPTTTVVSPREVFAVALKSGASSIILAHNHPSGNPTPSVQDREVTAALTSMGIELGVKVADHLILSDGNHVSLVVNRRGSVPRGGVRVVGWWSDVVWPLLLLSVLTNG